MPNDGILSNYKLASGGIRIWVVDADGFESLQDINSVMAGGSSVFGTTWFVDPTNGSDTDNDGLSSQAAFATVQKAVNSASSGDAIQVAEGFHDQVVSIPRSVGALTIIGAGGRGATGLESSTVGAIALTYNNDDLTLVNFGVSAESTATHAIYGTGSRFRAYGCKFEGAVAGLGLAVGSVANIGLGTEGKGSDVLLVDCENAWTTNGIELIASDYGVPTEIFFEACRFHNISGIHIVGVPGAFGIDSTRTFEANGCKFDNDEAGTAPSKFIELNGADDSGVVSNCVFAMATNASAKADIGAKILWVANKTEAGVSTARPA